MELIEREALLNKLPNCDLEKDEKISKIGAIADMVMLVCDAPTVDAVSIIRCKDCEWMLYESERWKEYPEQEWCDYYEHETNANGFCYRAEKRNLSLEKKQAIKTSDKKDDRYGWIWK